MRTGAGAATSTGNLGFDGTNNPTAIPLLTKGRAESRRNQRQDMNYFLGLTSDLGKLAVDFEDKNSTTGTGGDGSGLNHPFIGNTVVTQNVWHHAAATYDTSTGIWSLYLDGNPDGQSTPRLASAPGSPIALPQNNSIQHAAIGSALTSTGVAAGFFQGQIDEPRVWSVARSQAQIQASMNSEVTSGTGLIGRWGLNEGSGGTATGSVGPTGTLTNGPTWVAGAPALNAPPPPLTNPALNLDGSTQYGSFGAAPGLGASSLTLELWFMRTGAGVATSSGSLGLDGTTNPTAIPLLTKGRAEADGTTQDMNYFLGLTSDLGKLAVDFEDKNSTTGGTGDGSGLNHPFIGNTVVTQNVWHHAAATYDTSTGIWSLYLDGNPDGQSTPRLANAPGSPIALPQNNSIQHAAVGSALTSTGVAAGFFAGKIDEARVWNVVRSQSQIAATKNNEIPTATGLIGRWGMNEQNGASIADSSGGANPGTLVGGVTRVEGPVLTPLTPNDPPVMDSVTINQANPTTNTALTATLTSHDPNNDSITYTYQWTRTDRTSPARPARRSTWASASAATRVIRSPCGRLRTIRSARAPMTSSSVTVVNSPPSVTVGLSSSSPGTNDTLTATATPSDPDSSDTVTYTYQWRVNGTLRQTTNTGSTTDTFNLSAGEPRRQRRHRRGHRDPERRHGLRHAGGRFGRRRRRPQAPELQRRADLADQRPRGRDRAGRQRGVPGREVHPGP